MIAFNVGTAQSLDKHTRPSFGRYFGEDVNTTMGKESFKNGVPAETVFIFLHFFLVSPFRSLWEMV